MSIVRDWRTGLMYQLARKSQLGRYAIPPWCGMHPVDHFDGMGGCWGISNGWQAAQGLGYCKGCELFEPGAFAPAAQPAWMHGSTTEQWFPQQNDHPLGKPAFGLAPADLSLKETP